MDNFFKYDNPVMSAIAKIAKCVFLAVLWLVCCIPVITVGPSTCALYYTVCKTIRDDRSYVAQSFFHAFRSNFRQGVIVGVIVEVIELIFLGDYWLTKEALEEGLSWGNSYVLFLVLMVLVLLYGIWAMAVLASFENTTKAILKNSLILMIGNPGTTLLVALCLAFGVFVVWLIPVSVLLMPTVSAWLMSAVFDKAFQRTGQKPE